MASLLEWVVMVQLTMFISSNIVMVEGEKVRFGKRTALLALRKKGDKDIYAYEYECLRCASFFGIDGKAPPDPNNDTFHQIYNLTQVDRALCQDGPTLNGLEDSFAIVNRSVDQLGDSKCDFKATLDTADKNKLYAVTIYVHFPDEEKRAPTDKDRQQFKELMKVDDSMFKDKPILLMTQAIKRWKFSDDGTGKKNEWEGLMEQIEPPHAVYPLLFIAILAFMAFVIGTYLSGRHIAREYGFLPPLKDQGEEYRKELEEEEEEARREQEDSGMGPHDHEWTASTLIGFACCGVAFIFAVILALYFFQSTLSWLLLGIFFFGCGVAAGHIIFYTIVYYMMSEESLQKRVQLHNISWLCHPRVEYYKAICVACGFLLSAIWVYNRKEDWAWILQDILGICLCIYIASSVIMPNLLYCTVLLSGLLIYDVFMVYLTPIIFGKEESVMVAVAKGNENVGIFVLGLIKVPKYYPQNPWNGICDIPYSILGFGDIIIPGLLGGYCYGFDIIMKTPYNCLYFLGQIIAYILGIVTTFAILLITASPVPALVALVPSHLSAVYILYYLRPHERIPLMWGPTGHNRRLALQNAPQSGTKKSPAETEERRNSAPDSKDAAQTPTDSTATRPAPSGKQPPT